MALQGDVNDAGRLREAVEQVESNWGPIDLAIANAGIRHDTWVEEFELDWAKRLMETNYFGMLNLFDAVVPRMLVRGQGVFTGIASLAGVRCLPGGSAYGASKAAMRAFLDTVRLELDPRGVRVVTVSPWFIRTSGKHDGVPRPLVVEADWAAEAILRGIEGGKKEIEFPLVASLTWKVVRLLPQTAFAWLFDLRHGRASIGMRLLRAAGRKLSKPDVKDHFRRR